MVSICAACAAQTITASAPKKLVFRINVTAVAGSGIDLGYEGAAGGNFDSRLDTPAVTVGELGWRLLLLAPLVPALPDAKFRVRVTTACSGSPSNCDSRDYFLDWVPVQVTYTP